jgi:pantoate--beta-alanine ligase
MNDRVNPMKVIESIEEMRKARRATKGTVGFVPTMGFLHEGHLALVKLARKECQTVVVSIYVNPSQFAPHEDFQTYPRDMQRDLNLLKDETVNLVFTPTSAQMYPDCYTTWIKVTDLDKRLESQSRPHFFTGVATIVAKLFNIVRPHKAYFGEKDAQQLRIVTKMSADLNLGIQIVPVPTVRESDGLAMSSRNAYLNKDERKAATILWRTLSVAREMVEGGERDAQNIRDRMMEIITAEALAKLDYISVSDSNTLEELDTVEGPALISLAVWIGKTRLIDNITV